MARHAATARDGGDHRGTMFAARGRSIVAISALTAFVVWRDSATSPPSHPHAAASPSATSSFGDDAESTTTPPRRPDVHDHDHDGTGTRRRRDRGSWRVRSRRSGDSVMLDYQDPLKTAIPGVVVNAAVSRQWSDGEAILQTLKANGQLGGDVIVGLGTNGPITDADFDNMMAILGGASRVVFVNVHVDRPWQDPNNAVLANGAARYHNVVVADWATLAAQNPQWFGGDGTHLAIDGPGADALAALVASTLANG